MGISIEDQIKCVEREIKMRERVYPRWLAEGKMSGNQVAKEMACMKAVLNTLKELLPMKTQQPSFAL